MLKFVREIPPHIFYPGMVVGILLMSVVAHVVLLVMASSDGGPQVVPDYYEKAANWDEYQAREAAEAAEAETSERRGGPAATPRPSNE